MNDLPNLPQALSYDDVLLVPQYSEIVSRSKVDLTTKITPNIKIKLPIIASNMDTVTDTNMAITLGKLGGLAVLPRFNTINDQVKMVLAVKKEKLLVCAAIGIKEGYKERAQALVESGTDILLIDVAHGHMLRVSDCIKDLKNTYPHVDLIAGNIATYEAAKYLFLSGADCLKVGIGPGNACTTRIQTGFGVPQITAVLESARAAKEFSKIIMCDGGTKNTGDIVKGLAAGAHTVMIGSQFSATIEAPSLTIQKDGKTFKQYNGSTSAAEKLKLGLGEDNVEGASVLLPCTLSVKDLVNQFISGIKSGFSYAGANNIEEFHKNVKLVRISPQAWSESASRHLNK